MRPRTLEFLQAQADPGRAPLAVVSIWTAYGCRVYSSVGLTDAELWTELANRLDGSWIFDGSRTFGAQLLPVIAREARVLSFGILREEAGVLPVVGLQGDRVRTVTVGEIRLRNDDDHFGKLLAQETLVSSRLTYAIGYRDLRRDAWLTRFQGIIQGHELTREECLVRAEAA